MKRLFFLLVTLLTLCFNWTSCSDGGDETNGGNGNSNGGGGSSSSISLSKNELQFDSNPGYQTIKVTSTGEWTLSGGADWCDISPSSGKNGETVTINVDANATAADRTVTFTFKCGNQTAKLTVLQYGIIETSYVNLKIEDEGTSVEYNEQTGQTTLEYKGGNLPTVKEGQAFVLDEKYGYDIRKVTGFTKSGDKLVLQTEQGTMCDLFKNISFTLTTNPDLVATARSTGRVITPTTIEMITDNKRTVLFDKSALSSREVYANPIKIFNFNQDLSGMSLFLKEDNLSGEFKWKTWKANIGLDAVFQFDFGEKATGKTKIGELKNFKYYMQGNVDIDLLLSLETKAETFGFSIPDEKETVKKDIIPVISVKFMAGPVPVIITLETDLNREGEITCAGVVKTDAGFQFHADAKLGMEYDVRTREAHPITEFNPQFELHQPTYDIQASLEASAGYYPHLQFHFYKFLGPYLDIKPLYAAEIKAGMHYDSDNKEETLGWSAEFGTEIRREFGLELDWGLDEAKLKFIDDKLIKTTLFQAPASILLESPQNGHHMKVGEEAEVCFHVQAINYLTNELYDCPTALVQYATAVPEDNENKENDKGNGGRSTKEAQYAIADKNGRVKVKWSPTDKNEFLIAEIIHPEGESTDKAEFKPEIEDIRRSVLETIYRQTNGDNWKNKEHWLSNKPIHEWHGVHIEDNGKLSLDLGDNNLTGYINLDMTLDSLLSVANLFKEINCSNNQLTKLELLGHKSLESLECGNNPLEVLDIAGCSTIKELKFQTDYSSTPTLTYLYAGACTSLEKIECSNNKLVTLFLNGCTSLKELHCNDNELKELNLSGFTKLEFLDCRANMLEVLNLSDCTNLNFENLYLLYGENSLKTLDISGSTIKQLYIDGVLPKTLTTLNASRCLSLEIIQCSNNNLTALYLNDNYSLKSIECGGNNLTNLEISNCSKLKELYCGGNNLTNLDISQCPSLEWIDCTDNLFSSIDFSNSKSLKWIFCMNENLEQINLSGCTNLKEFRETTEHKLRTVNLQNCTSLEWIYLCGDLFQDSTTGNRKGKLTSLNISGCTSLRKLQCYNNQITSEIPNWFSQITEFKHDQRYTYWTEYITTNDGMVITKKHYTDHGIGWWYPGEPDKGYHGPN